MVNLCRLLLYIFNANNSVIIFFIFFFYKLWNDGVAVNAKLFLQRYNIFLKKLHLHATGHEDVTISLK